MVKFFSPAAGKEAATRPDGSRYAARRESLRDRWESLRDRRGPLRGQIAGTVPSSG